MRKYTLALLLTLSPLNTSADKPFDLVSPMLPIPGGSFLMGSDDARPAEMPVHRVNIKSFTLAETEVTQWQWHQIMGSNPSHFSGCDLCPVEQVSWNDIQIYIKKLNQLTGKRYRLPSEAEWEYACRSGGKDEYYCGGKDRDALSWYLSNSGEQTQPVKTKQANGLGLHDMSGNVSEWTQDCWNFDYNGAPEDGSAWQSGYCDQRVLRGGSWNSFRRPGFLRSVFRYRQSRHKSHLHIAGFRLAHDIENTR